MSQQLIKQLIQQSSIESLEVIAGIIPGQIDHPFRFKSIAESGTNRSPIPI